MVSGSDIPALSCRIDLKILSQRVINSSKKYELVSKWNFKEKFIQRLGHKIPMTL